MSFRIATSPHQHSLAQTPALMRTVALACLPGIAAQLYFFGYAVLIQIALAIVTAWASEALHAENTQQASTAAAKRP